MQIFCKYFNAKLNQIKFGESNPKSIISEPVQKYAESTPKKPKNESAECQALVENQPALTQLNLVPIKLVAKPIYVYSNFISKPIFTVEQGLSKYFPKIKMNIFFKLNYF